MNRSPVRRFVCGLAVFLTASVGRAQTLTAEQWRADVAFVDASIRTHHPNPFHATSEEAFERRVKEMHDRIPGLADHEVLAEMAATVASLRDGHTKIQGGFQFLTGQYPLRLYVFEDGIFVRSAPAALQGTIGARLLSIGETPAEEAYRRVSAMVSFDNDMTLRNRVPQMMASPEALHAFKVTPDRHRTRFVFADREDRAFILDLAPVPFDQPLDWVETPLAETRPLSARHPGVNYWHEHLEEAGTLYVQYNRVRNAADESIERYFARLTELVQKISCRRIVLDLRYNGGGNDYFNAPVVEWVRSSLPIAGGHFYVIIGRGTYSAAQKLVTRLEAMPAVTFVGEPTGGSPNHFGDAAKLQLPHSGLTLKVSERYHHDAPGNDRLTTAPDIPAPLFAADFFSGRDPALEAALSASAAGSPPR